ncbi:MAG: FAD/NAD(P)-binding protein [Burkholderiaceae bacterium]
MSALKQLVIIGAGFSGVALAIHASRATDAPLDILLVDPRPEPGSGLAHSTTHPDHRLNGLATLHTIYPEAPAHFSDWVRDGGVLASDPAALAPNGGVYARRRDFGRYMALELARHADRNPSGSRLDTVRGRAVGIRRSGAGLCVELQDGRELTADRCVLAVGWNAVGVPGPLNAIVGNGGWIGDPWHEERVARIPPRATVLLMGTGLTASDTFATLMAQGHQGAVVALSRRGLRPGSQSPFPSRLTSVWGMLRDPHPAFVARHGTPTTIRGAMRRLREDIAGLDPSCTSWHAPFDELRNAVAQFWPALTSTEQRRYVRHVKAWYDTFRFRNPPQIERIVDAGVARGQLRFVAGHVRDVQAVGSAIDVGYDPRRGSGRMTLRADVVVNCTGPNPRPSASGNPLWQRLIRDGWARDHPCGVGVDVDLSCRVVDAAGRSDGTLFCIGPPTMGTFGEATAVPYVARQVLDTLPALLYPGAGAASADAVRGA